LRVTKSRGKAKQVEFNEQVEIANVESLSDLTELSDTERYAKPSPRRLRSQGERIAQSPPKRKGKNKASNFVADVDTVDDEVDELLSSRDAPSRPIMNDRTPVKRRLRPRPIQTHTPPDESDDGDDEGGEEVEIGEVERAAEDDGESVGEAEEEEENDEAEEDDATLVEPRKLRNGKIVGEEEDSESPDELEQEASDESAQEVVPLDEEIDLEVEDDESDESSHEEFMSETEDGEQRPPLEGPV
jgi:mitogen-activated protein kinase kinase kinase 13